MGIVVIPHSTSPYFEVYDESTLLKAVDFSMKPGANPTGTAANAAAISPNGVFVAIGHSSSPYLSVYNTTTWDRVTLSGGNPTGSVNEVHFSPNNTLMAVAHGTAPFVTVYNTATWTKVTLTGGGLAGTGRSCQFSPSGDYLAVSSTTSPFLTVYATSDWSKVSLPAAPSANTPAVAWTSSGALIVTDGNQIRVYNPADWTSDLRPTTPLSFPPQRLAVTPDGTKVICGDFIDYTHPLVNISDGSLVAYSNSTPSGITGYGFIEGGAYCLFVSTSSPYLFRLDMNTLTFSGVTGSTYLANRRMPAVGGQALKFLKTSPSDPVRGADGNPMSGVEVRAHRRSSGLLFATTTTAADGSYTLGPFMLDHGEAQVLFLDPTGDPLYNDLVVRAFPA